MGGGGGAGDANNAINGVKGGVGGAIILINAGNIQGSGTIKANGGPGAPGSYAGSPDGAGGGGAGGSVFLNISNNNAIATNVTIEANGGRGGNTLNDLGNSHGPGGGGGGGIIRYNVPGTGVTINPSIAGGASGGTDNGSTSGESHGAQPGQAGSAKSFISSDVPSYLQVNASCFPILETKVTALTKTSVCGATGEKISYEIQIKNTGTGNAAGVSLDFLFPPTSIEFDSSTASYSTEASGPSGALSYTGTANNPVIGDFNIAQNGVVTITLVGRITGAIAAGTHSSSAQALYLDPTRTGVNSNRKITPLLNAYGTVNKKYEGANQADVPGTNFNGVSPTKVDDITILALPAAPTVETTQGICATPTGTITVTAPLNATKYTLTGTNPVTSPVNNTNGVFSGLVSGTYQVTTTNADGCTSLPTSGIQITAVAGAPAAKGVSICVGDTGFLTSTSTCIIDWYTVPSGGTNIGSGNSFNPVNRPNSGLPDTNTARSVTFYAACPGNTNCRTAVNFVINAKPTITAVDSKSLCDSGSVTLGATASSGTINWYTAVTGGSLVATGTNSYTTPSLSATTDYYVEAVANGCISSARTKVTATVNTTPKITGTTSGSRCGAGTVPLSASASAGTINWYSNVTGGTWLATGTSYTPNVSVTTTYYVDATINDCTTGSRIAVAATVNPLPTAYTVTGGGASCSAGTGFAVGLDNSDIGVSYQLQLGGSNNGTAVAGTGSSISFGLKTAAGTYTVVATNASTTCTAPMTGNAVVTISPIPTAPTVGIITHPTCTVATGSVVLNGLPSGNWTINPGNITG
ncbi:hypothetical protein NJT12_19735, partial [Flavobacterium sp. AC]|nr:hypothetical protein [Flavobacterium azizsancarii]